MTATLAPSTESLPQADRPSRSVRARSGATRGSGGVAVPGRPRTVDGDREPGPALRIRPVPRSEPLADEERSAELPGVARLLPPDLATGVRVRRGPGVRAAVARNQARGFAEAGSGGVVPAPAEGGPAEGGSVGGGAGAGAVGDARPAPAPTVVRTPETVLALVATPLHAAGPAQPRTAGGAVLTVSAPGLGHAAVDHPPRSLDLRATAKRLLGTCIEVLGGFRPVAQLRPYCAPERFDAIVNRLLRPLNAGRGHGATRTSLIAGRAAPGKPGRPARTAPEDRIVVRRVQICDVMEGIAELAVVMARHNKVWAMTMRLERSRGRWLCMHLEVL